MRILSSFIINFLIYVAIVAGLVLGLPELLSWRLGTPYPMAAITSGSMWPALREGDLVFIQGAEKSDLAVGDVVVYRNDGGPGFTIHRIVRLDEETFTTKGDANFENDKPVPYGRLVGRNLTVLGKPARLPYLGSITVVASTLRDDFKK
jgi:signal peptidase I